VDGSEEVTNNNWLGIAMGNNGTEEDKKQAIISTAHNFEPIPVQTARDAYDAVILHVGASFKRDTMDQRIIENVKKRTGGFIDVQGGFPHGTAYELTVNAWPALKSLVAPVDSDKDGMPDDWEKKNGLNPAEAADAAQYKISKGYTNIEVYLNGLLK